MLRQLSDLLTLVLGLVLAGIGLESFLLPNHFIDGGITGISMLLASQTGLSLSIFLVLINLPFIVLGYRHLGRTFAIKSSIAIIALAVILAVVHFPVATHDKLLGAIFGGFFLGAGVGLAIRSGSVLDGTEILALLASLRTFATVGEIIMLLNAVIFLFAAFFLGAEPAMYSMLTYFAASKTIDYLLHGIEAYQGILIFTQEPKAIRQVILTELGRGVTSFKSRGGYTENDSEVLLCVVTRLEANRLQGVVQAKDPAAFIVTLPVLDTHGGIVKRRAFH
ncbi:MAG: YitT family protein [Pirellulaceae bacterium]|jgi:uncharacterized membrane-anchored protein YitT (DUF2179 family)